jgi:ATP-dependent Clp protease ATP-binding subunit ClpB
VFHALDREHVRAIVDIQVRRLAKRLADRQLVLDVSDAAKDYLAQRGYDPVFGARPLKRVIQNEIETPLAERIIAGELRDGMHVAVDVASGGGLTFTPVVEAQVVSDPPSGRSRRAG